MRNIGIDFGTCNLKGAERKKNGDITYVKLGKAIDKPRIPNVILYEKNEEEVSACIGDVASRKPKPEQDKIRSIKTHLQEKEWNRELSFGGVVSAFQVTADIMKSLYNEIHDTNKNEDIAATITVPVNFSKRQRMLIEKAAANAGFNVKATITEPFASVFFLMNENIVGEEDDHEVLVFDFGGGTLDLCLVSIRHRKGIVKVETKSNIGITYGGNDINKTILDRIVRKQSSDKIEEAIDKEKNILHRAVNHYFVMEAINDLKADLFEDDEVEKNESRPLMVQLYGGSVVDFGDISVEQIYELFDEDGFAERIPQLLLRLFEDCEITPDEVTDVFMIGGTSSIPYFRNVLSTFFEKYGNSNVDDLFNMNDEMDRDERIYSSVSMGAVAYSELLENDDIEIKDKIPFYVYSKNSEGGKETRLDINSGCFSPYASLSDSVKQEGVIAVYQTIFGEDEKEVFLGNIEIDDEMKEYATLYKLSVDDDGNIIATFAYMMEDEEEPSDEWAKELHINLD